MTPGRPKERPPGGLTRCQDGYVRTSLLTHIITHSFTYLLTYLLTYVLNYIFTLLTYPLNHLLTYPSLPTPIYLLTHVPAHSLADLFIYALTYLLTYWLIYLLTHLLHHFLSSIFPSFLTFLSLTIPSMSKFFIGSRKLNPNPIHLKSKSPIESRELTERQDDICHLFFCCLMFHVVRVSLYCSSTGVICCYRCYYL